MVSRASASLSLRPLKIAKLPWIAAKSTSSSTRGACAASSGTSRIPAGFSITSSSVTSTGLPFGRSLIQPRSRRILSARSRFTGSLGTATVAPRATPAVLRCLRE